MTPETPSDEAIEAAAVAPGERLYDLPPGPRYPTDADIDTLLDNLRPLGDESPLSCYNVQGQRIWARNALHMVLSDRAALNVDGVTRLPTAEYEAAAVAIDTCWKRCLVMGGYGDPSDIEPFVRLWPTVRDAPPRDRLRASAERKMERLRLADGVIADLETELERLQAIEAAARAMRSGISLLPVDGSATGTDCAEMRELCDSFDAALTPSVDTEGREEPTAERLDSIPSHTSPTTDGFTYVQIDRLPYRVRVGSYTGAQIRAFAAPPIADDRDIWLQRPGDGDLLIRDYDSLIIGPTTGTRFWTHPRFINAG